MSDVPEADARFEVVRLAISTAQGRLGARKFDAASLPPELEIYGQAILGGFGLSGVALYDAHGVPTAEGRTIAACASLFIAAAYVCGKETCE